MQPNSPLNHYQSLFDFFASFESVQNNKVLLLGDFNITSHNKTLLLKDFLAFADFNQLNTLPNQYGNILDLVITNVDCAVTRESIPLVPEDLAHPTLSIEINTRSGLSSGGFPCNSNKSYNFNKANYPLMYQLLYETDWNFLSAEELDINTSINLFYTTFYNILDQTVPLYYKSTKNKISYPSWYTKDIIKDLDKKKRLHNKYKKSKLKSDYDIFSRLRHTIKIKIDLAYKSYIYNTESFIKNDPKHFWKYIRQKRQRSRIPGSMIFNQRQLDSPQHIVDGFANFFKSVYVASSPFNPSLYSSYETSNSQNISITNITQLEVTNALERMKNTKTAGHDEIPSFVLRDCSQCLAVPLQFIFNKVLKSGTFPEQWKVTKICPVFKSGQINNISNYRPISILSNFSKAFEICIHNNLFHQVKNLISTAQHGFFSKRSTLTNLSSFLQRAYQAVDGRKQLDVIYTDFSKAFDKLDHGLIAQKMYRVGFHKGLVSLFVSYLSGRTQFVEFNGFKSAPYNASSGAPQGSNLAPLIFAIFVNDITNNISSDCVLFADDLKIYRIINNIEDCRELQKDINSLSVWCSNNKLMLNINKCHSMTISNLNQELNFAYSLDNSTLTSVESIRDLGVIIDKKLTFNGHIDELVQATLRTLGFIYRSTKDFTKTESLITLYNSLIKSKLQYAALIWFPCYETHVDRLEYVQRRFLKYLSFKQDGTFPPRGFDHKLLLQRFDFLSLKQNTILASQLFLFKICNNLVDSGELLNNLNFFVPSMNTRSHHRFYLDNFRTNLARKAPIYRACSWFNQLSNTSDIDLFHGSVNSFKTKIIPKIKSTFE